MLSSSRSLQVGFFLILVVPQFLFAETKSETKLEVLLGQVGEQIVESTDGSSSSSFILTTASGKNLPVDLTRLDRRFTPGEFYILKGRKNTQGIYSILSAVEVSKQAKAQRYNVKRLTKGSSKPMSEGSFRIAVISFEFSDFRSNCSQTEIESMMYTSEDSARTHLEVNSRGLFSLDGDADSNGKFDFFGPYLIDGPYAEDFPSVVECATDPEVIGDEENEGENFSAAVVGKWMTKAKKEAASQGFNYNLYDAIFYFGPKYEELVDSCGVGFANLDCINNRSYLCRAYIGNCSSRTTVHELGHLLGLSHASSDLDNDGVIEEEYGDLSSPMGRNYLGITMFNAPGLFQLDWFNRFPAAVKTVEGGGLFGLAALERDPSNHQSAQMLRLPLLDNDFYTISFRGTEGLFASRNSNVRKKISIHRHSPYAQSHEERVTKLLGFFASGEQFVDYINGITVDVVLASEKWGVVKIRRDRSSDSVNSSIENTTFEPETITAVSGLLCVDRDGDGWGWNGESKCRALSTTPRDLCVDYDGDGWGWNGSTSCQIE